MPGTALSRGLSNLVDMRPKKIRVVYGESKERIGLFGLSMIQVVW